MEISPRTKRIGEILIEKGILTREQVEKGLKEQHRLLGEVLLSHGALTQEQIEMALSIQKNTRNRVKKTIVLLASILIAFLIVYIPKFTSNTGIVIREAKIVTGVDAEMRPLKVTALFPKDTSKVCAWIRWVNAKINSQVFVKWYYVTDDMPIYDYTLNIPKRDGIANVVLAMPQGKTLPSGVYKVTIYSGKKSLIKPLVFEIA
jgi:hypothetical protein